MIETRFAGFGICFGRLGRFPRADGEHSGYEHGWEKAGTRWLKVGRCPNQKQILPGRVPSIDGQRITRHEATGTAQHERHRAPGLFRRRWPSQRILLLRRPSRARILPEVLFHHRRHDMPGTQTIHPDALLSPDQVSPRLGDGCFRGDVYRQYFEGYVRV